MIEPQNTVFPVAAEPRPAQQPQSEEAGFGAMLAQSLGLVSQLDPGAVQQIVSGHHQQRETTGDGMTDDTDQRSGDGVPDAKATPLSLGASLTSPRLDAVGRFRAADAVPLTGDSSVPLPPSTATNQPVSIEVPTAAAEDPLLITPAVQITGGEAELEDPVNGVSQTLPTDESMPAPPAIDRGGLETLAPEAFDAGKPIGRPVVGDVGDNGISAPVVQRHVVDPAPGTTAPGSGIDRGLRPLPEPAPPTPVASNMQPAPTQQHLNPQPDLAELPQSVIPAHGDAKPVADRPVPKASAPAETSEPTVAAETTKGPATVATPGPSVEPRIDLAPEIPVQMDTPSRSVTVAAAEVSTEAAPAVVADGGPANAPVSFTAPAASQALITAPASLAEPPDAQTSALAERVLQAVDLQRTQPPPRSMVVEIPEIEGLRLVVSVRSGGQVSVTQAGGANAEAFAPFAEDLSRVLSQRGFVMNGDDRRNGHNPDADEERTPLRAPRSNFRRPVRQRQDNDLRI